MQQNNISFSIKVYEDTSVDFSVVWPHFSGSVLDMKDGDLLRDKLDMINEEIKATDTFLKILFERSCQIKDGVFWEKTLKPLNAHKELLQNAYRKEFQSRAKKDVWLVPHDQRPYVDDLNELAFKIVNSTEQKLTNEFNYFVRECLSMNTQHDRLLKSNKHLSKYIFNVENIIRADNYVAFAIENGNSPLLDFMKEKTKTSERTATIGNLARRIGAHNIANICSKIKITPTQDEEGNVYVKTEWDHFDGSVVDMHEKDFIYDRSLMVKEETNALKESKEAAAKKLSKNEYTALLPIFMKKLDERIEKLESLNNSTATKPSSPQDSKVVHINKNKI